MVYHKDVNMTHAVWHEAAMVLCRLGGRYRLSAHARQRKVQKDIDLPERIPIADCTIVEVTGSPCIKMLVRFPYGEKDVVMGLTTDGLVTTIYHNEQDDHHATLDIRRYA